MDRAFNRVLWLHKKTGKIYQIVSFALEEQTLAIVVAYRAFAEDKDVACQTWTRPVEEFFDGRFTIYEDLPLFASGGAVKGQHGGLMRAASVDFPIPADRIVPPQEPPEGPGATVSVSVRQVTTAPAVDPVEERRKVDDGA